MLDCHISMENMANMSHILDSSIRYDNVCVNVLQGAQNSGYEVGEEEAAETTH